MQTGKHAANVGSRLKLAWKPGRRHLKSQPSSRIGENPPYGMIGGIEETSASCEARYAPRSYPTLLICLKRKDRVPIAVCDQLARGANQQKPSSPSTKIFRLTCNPNHAHNSAHLTH